MPQGMPKVEEEIEKIKRKIAGDNEILAHELDFFLHGFSVTVIQEYRKMMADEIAYKPEEIKHG
jgi:hypothetical protein